MFSKVLLACLVLISSLTFVQIAAASAAWPADAEEELRTVPLRFLPLKSNKLLKFRV